MKKLCLFVLFLILNSNLLFADATKTKKIEALNKTPDFLKKTFTVMTYYQYSHIGIENATQLFKDKIILEFRDKDHQLSFKPGDALTIMNLTTGESFNTAYEKNVSSLFPNSEPQGFYGVATLKNFYDGKTKDDEHIGFKDFDVKNLEKCSLQTLNQVDNKIINLISSRLNKKNQESKVLYNHIQNVILDNKNYLLVNYRYLQKEHYGDTEYFRETLFFEKNGNEHKLLFTSLDDTFIKTCFKEKGKTSWQFLVNQSTEYTGSVFWGELTLKRFKSVFQENAWMD